MKKALKVVVPPSAASAPSAGAAYPRLGPGRQAPILGHRPGIDKTEYGSREFAACKDQSNYSIENNGRAYKIFFFCGHPRSGTHWVDGILKLHPHVWIDGEYRLESLHNSLNDLTGRGWHACFREPMRSQAIASFHRSVREIIGSSWSMRPHAQWLGDRTPRPARCFLPGAPHILIIRDPRDVIVSWAHQDIKNAGYNFLTGGFEPHFRETRKNFLADPKHFEKNPQLLLTHEPWTRWLAHRWRNHMRVDLECLRKFDAAESSGGIAGGAARCLVVRYEKIHTDPEAQRRQIYEFLDLDPALAGPLTHESRTKPLLANENPHGVYRKGAVGDWRTYFNDDVKRWFKDEAQDTLEELGYEADDKW